MWCMWCGEVYGVVGEVYGVVHVCGVRCMMWWVRCIVWCMWCGEVYGVVGEVYGVVRVVW